MDAELVVLASSAATTIVGLMATDAWGKVKERVRGLWRRFRPEQADAVAAELDRARLEIEDGNETVALAITRDWESRLLRLLAGDATVAAELTRIATELEQILAGQQARGPVQQNATASRHSSVIQIGGDGIVGKPLVRQSADAEREAVAGSPDTTGRRRVEHVVKLRATAAGSSIVLQAGRDLYVSDVGLESSGKAPIPSRVNARIQA